MVIAHTDKNDGDTRGYSGIEDDADVVWAAKRKDNKVTLRLTKMKDGPDGAALELAAVPTLGSLTLERAQHATALEHTANARAILAFLAGEVTEGCTAAQIVDGAGVARATCYRTLDALVKSGQVTKSGPRTQSRYCIGLAVPRIPTTALDSEPGISRSLGESR